MPILDEIAIILGLCLLCEGLAALLPFPFPASVLSLLLLLALLAAYNAVTKYQYSHEWERKRDRTAEAINSTTAKVTEFRRGLSYWAQMTEWYAVEVTDQSTLKAFQDSGVRYVKWNTMNDGRECSTCKERDGKIYPIRSIPPKPHPGCRCWYTPTEKK